VAVDPLDRDLGWVHPIRWAVASAKVRAAKKGLPFDLYDHVEHLRLLADRGCQLTGIPFDVSMKGGRGRRNPRSLSIDRIDGNKGYVRSNVRLILWGLNIAFNNWGEDEFEEIARAWLKRKEMISND